MGGECSGTSDARQARREEAERRAKVPPLRITVEHEGRPPSDLSVKPYERIGTSLDRELKLEGLDQAVREVWLGQQELDINGVYETQGVESGLLLRIVLRNIVLRGHTEYVNAVAALPNGGIVTGSDDNTAIIWSADGKLEKVLCGHEDCVNDLAVLANGDIITGSDDSTAIIWSAEGEIKQVLSVPNGSVCAVAALANGDVITGSDDNNAIIWSAEGTQKRVLSGHHGPISAVAVLPNGDIVTGSGDKTAIIWSADGTQKRVLRGHTDYVLAVAGLLDGNIVTGSEDSTAIIWSAEGEQKQVLRPRTGSVSTMAVLPNGDVVTGSHNQAAIVWSAEGKQKRVLRKHTNAVAAVAVLPNGDIVTGSDDKTAIIWSAHGDDELEHQIGLLDAAQSPHEHSIMGVGVPTNGHTSSSGYAPLSGVILEFDSGADGEQEQVLHEHSAIGVLGNDDADCSYAPLSNDDADCSYAPLDRKPVTRVERSYSDLLSTEAGLTINTIREACLEYEKEAQWAGIDPRNPLAKDEILSTAQRIWNSRQPKSPDAVTRSPVHLVFRRTHSALAVDENGQPRFRRSYSALCADEAGVPIDVIKEVLVEEGRDESATPRVLSAAQRIWESRKKQRLSADFMVPQQPDTDDVTSPRSIQSMLAACRTYQ